MNIFQRNSKRVCGHTIKRMSARAMLESVSALQDVAVDIAHQIIVNDGAGAEEILNNGAAGIVGMVFKSGPAVLDAFFAWLSKASGIPKEALDGDDKIGLGGTAKVLVAVWELNGFDDFFALALPVLKKGWQGITGGKSQSNAGNTNLS